MNSHRLSVRMARDSAPPSSRTASSGKASFARPASSAVSTSCPSARSAVTTWRGPRRTRPRLRRPRSPESPGRSPTGGPRRSSRRGRDRRRALADLAAHGRKASDVVARQSRGGPLAAAVCRRIVLRLALPRLPPYTRSRLRFASSFRDENPAVRLPSARATAWRSVPESTSRSGPRPRPSTRSCVTISRRSTVRSTMERSRCASSNTPERSSNLQWVGV